MNTHMYPIVFYMKNSKDIGDSNNNGNSNISNFFREIFDSNMSKVTGLFPGRTNTSLTFKNTIL